MRDHVVIENIAALRRCEGIEDPELREAIRGLGVGDLVKLTLLAQGAGGETVRVRIVRIYSDGFGGRLAEAPKSRAFQSLQAGSTLRFGHEHIHSVPKTRPDEREAPSRRPRAACRAPVLLPESRPS